MNLDVQQIGAIFMSETIWEEVKGYANPIPENFTINIKTGQLGMISGVDIHVVKDSIYGKDFWLPLTNKQWEGLFKPVYRATKTGGVSDE